MPKGISTNEKTPLKDNSSSIFVHAVLIPCILVGAIQIAMVLALPFFVVDVGVYSLVASMPIGVFIFRYTHRYGIYKPRSRNPNDANQNKKFWKAPSKILITLIKVLHIVIYLQVVLSVVIVAIFYSVSEETRKSTYPYPLQGGEFGLVQLTLGQSILLIFYYLYSIGYFDRDFQFIMAQKCMIEAKVKDDQADKISHLIDGLSSYDKYLKRRFDLQFDETRVASNIISSSADKNQIIDTIEKSFMDKPDDKLKPTNCLSTFANLQPQEQFLRRVKLSTKVKEIGFFLAAIISVLIAVIQFVILFVYPR